MDALKTHHRKIAVLGLGYVGLSSAVAFGQAGSIVGFDINAARIETLKKGIDTNGEVKEALLKSTQANWTTNPRDLATCDFFILSLPTPLTAENSPDLSILLNATEMVARVLKQGDIVVYESTVYPGATEEKCIPLLEEKSGLSCGKDFTVGYSPERINPGDQTHTFFNLIKVIAATDEATLDIMQTVYESVVTPGVHRVKCIKVAEAAKVIENTQRDVNIAFLNDMALLLHKLNIPSADVFEAMKTKWNSLAFKSGLVGGSCIGVNTYYLMYKANQVNYHSDLLISTRRMNESIAIYIAHQASHLLAQQHKSISGASVAVLGMTYKPDCASIQNTRTIDIINELKKLGVNVFIHDAHADPKTVLKTYQLTLTPLDEMPSLDGVIIAVAHQDYREMKKNDFEKLIDKNGFIIDVNEILPTDDFENSAITLWQF